jgi:hypothetical protein
MGTMTRSNTVKVDDDQLFGNIIQLYGKLEFLRKQSLATGDKEQLKQVAELEKSLSDYVKGYNKEHRTSISMDDLKTKGLKWLKDAKLPAGATKVSAGTTKSTPSSAKVQEPTKPSVPVVEPPKHDSGELSHTDRMKADFVYFCEHGLEIPYRPGMNRDFPDGGYGPLILNEAQKKVVAVFIYILFIECKPLRAIILKSRQLGCTTLLLAFELWLLMTRSHYRILFIIDKGAHGRTKRLLVINWIENINKKYPDDFPSVVTKDDKFILLSNGSMLLFESAEAPNPGTSEMIHGLHESEKPKWPANRAQEVEESITPGIPFSPFTLHINESTAEGMEKFYHEWKRAESGVAGELGDIPIFLPWFVSPEYSLPAPQDFTFLNEDSELCEVDDNGQFLYSEEEYARKYSLTNDQVYWRRQKIKGQFKGNRNSFDQEYPTTPGHAWRSVSTSYFAREMLDKIQMYSVRQPVFVGRLENKSGPISASHPPLFTTVSPIGVPDRVGDLKIWEVPQYGETYYLGGDVAEGKTIIAEGGSADPDYTVFRVKKGNGQTVASFRARIKPEEGWVPLLLLAVLYNMAWVNVERNKDGATMLAFFSLTGYPNMMVLPGNRPAIERTWLKLDASNRKTVLNHLRASYNADYTRVLDFELLDELRHFTVDAKTGNVGAASGHHDDIVLAEAHAEAVRRFILGLDQVNQEQTPITPPTPPDPRRDPTSSQFQGFTLEDCYISDSGVWDYEEEENAYQSDAYRSDRGMAPSGQERPGYSDDKVRSDLGEELRAGAKLRFGFPTR